MAEPPAPPADSAAARIELVDPDAFPDLCQRLGVIIAEAVHDGAGVNFVLPFTDDDGAAYWRSLTEDIRAGRRIVLVARSADDEVVGTVTLMPAPMPNQPHRADIGKLLVARAARRQGIATALMEQAASVARRSGRTLLTLDCVAGGGEEAFYRGVGYQVVGTIPGYALSPTGAPEAATLMYRDLTAETPHRCV